MVARLEHLLLGMVTLQFLLGIGTLLMAGDGIPVFMGVAHQVGAFVLSGIATALLFYAKRRTSLHQE
jgi:heme A synthase